jgi:hypothetical protein
MDYSYDNLGYGVRLFTPDGSQDVFLQDEAASSFLDELHGALDTWVQTEAFPTPDDLEQWYISQYFETPQQPAPQYKLRLVNPSDQTLRYMDKYLPVYIPSTVEKSGDVGLYILTVPSWESFIDTVAREFYNILSDILLCIQFDNTPQQIYVVQDINADWILDDVKETLPIHIGSPSIWDSQLDVCYTPVTIPSFSDFIQTIVDILTIDELQSFVPRIRFKV